MPDGGPRLDIQIGPNGYAWWYLDGLSDDHRHGITIIALIGSVFSPYYAWAREKGPVEAENHCAMNVALYGQPGARWAMTERGAGDVNRKPNHLTIGPSSLRWENGTAIVELKEIAVPVPRPIRGRVTITPTTLNDQDFALDSKGRHRWWPIAPCARIRVEMDTPALIWEGSGYMDSNRGSAPLEDDFQCWDWSRAELPNGDAVVYYDLTQRDLSHRNIAHRFFATGGNTPVSAPPKTRLPNINWQVARTTRSDSSSRVKLIKTLEDTPFYARSAIQMGLEGEVATGVHESLNLDRFKRRWVQVLLPFRMPRKAK
ncbi:MAG: carotenoid 1,2-hydratase [Alphaproteobacteria bacterium]|nr:carotenoid 1,2-hydratase [Alphaproteobacteria bacterium]